MWEGVFVFEDMRYKLMMNLEHGYWIATTQPANPRQTGNVIARGSVEVDEVKTTAWYSFARTFTDGQRTAWQASASICWVAREARPVRTVSS